ncbi:MAG: hypothetical protein COB09_14305 [Thalassobium sp.]|nr:MAG: hypothetical protein COB09_14305 [Thalassobium sp.]
MDYEQEETEELLPPNVRRTGFWASLLFSVALIGYFVTYVFNQSIASPKDLGLSSLLLFAVACFLFFAVPWHRLGLSLKKFGPLEFERKLEGQSEEHIKDISALEDKIAQIEAAIQSGSSHQQIGKVPQKPEEIEMRDLIIKFLSEYSQWSFSPLRIENWGAERNSYSDLAGNSALLRRLLRSLVSEGILETTISKKGNTLYRIKN